MKAVFYTFILCISRNLPGTLLYNFLKKIILKRIFIKICTLLNTKLQSYSFISGTKEMTRILPRDKGCILALSDFPCLIVSRGFLNSHWDVASSMETGHLGRFISNEEISHIQTKPSYITAMVLWAGLCYSPVISFPLPCRVAAQRMRTEVKMILAIAMPVLDKRFLPLRFRCGRAWPSVHVGSWVRCFGLLPFSGELWLLATETKRFQWEFCWFSLFHTLSREPVSSACSAWIPASCLTLRRRHFKIAGLVHVYPSEHLFPLAPWTPNSQEPDLQTSDVRCVYLQFHFCPHTRWYYSVGLEFCTLKTN